MAKRNPSYCYFCGTEAITREHFPPKCFFPKEKELIHLPEELRKNYRVNLESVPSCLEHNSSYSKDDEYLLLLVSSHLNINNDFRKMFTIKNRRAIEERPKLINLINGNPRPVFTEGKIGIAVNVDRDRILKELDKIARAIYYHEFNERWQNEISFETPAITRYRSGQEYIKEFRELEELSKKFLRDEPLKGKFPEIFCYKIYRDIENCNLLIHFLFYQGLPIIAYSPE